MGGIGAAMVFGGVRRQPGERGALARRRRRARTEGGGEIGAFFLGDLAEHKSKPEQAAQQEHLTFAFVRAFGAAARANEPAKPSSDASRSIQDFRSNAARLFYLNLIFRRRDGNQAETILLQSGLGRLQSERLP
ncbi:MAG TPA: hypothetical protein VMU18_10150 [Rhodoblastus sp.]|nr:hypothetical protein [Rhodoblastus sp.]